MTGWLITFFIVVIVFVIAALAISKQTTAATLVAKKPLTNPEQILYLRIVKALPEHIVLAQVSFSSFLKANGGTQKENWKSFASIKQKVADYLICSKDFAVLAVIELDDSTHNEANDKKRDSKLTSAGLKIIRWNVKNLPNSQEIIDAIAQIGNEK